MPDVIRGSMLCRRALIAVWLGFAAAALAQTSDVPRTEGKTLAGASIVLADAIKGKPAVLVVTFSRAAGNKAAEWSKALRQKEALPPACTLYQVTELEDVPRFIRWSVVAGIRRGVPQEMHARFVVLTAATDEWKRFAAVKNNDDPYVIVLAASGAVKARVAGEPTPENLKRVTGAAQ